MRSTRALRTHRVTATFVAMLLVSAALVATGVPALAAGVYDPFFAPPTTIGTVPPTTFSNPAARPFGQAAGDYTGDGNVDVLSGRVDGWTYLSRGNGDGTFLAPTQVVGKLVTNNGWAITPADLNADGKLDLIWGATTASAPIAIGDVRVWYGNGNGTFVSTGFTNAGTLLANVGPLAVGSITAGDIDGDSDIDVIAGASDTVKILRNNAGTFAVETLNTGGVYFPAVAVASGLVNSPWGLSLGDADGDGDRDLFVGDRALYVYLFRNDGAGNLAMKTANAGLPPGRENAYIDHDHLRASVGFTPSLASPDVNGDGKADLVLALQSGTQTPASGTANDGLVALDVSTTTGHGYFGALADVGTMARGVQASDVNGDGAVDLTVAEYTGKLTLLRQLPPIDTDSDGVSDYVDNAPEHANAPRIDMNTDGAYNAADQLDNDFDTVLGDPEDTSTWTRLGDPADDDDDNDGVLDGEDNCRFVANSEQNNRDAADDESLMGNACDPLDNTDTDGDGVPDGPAPTDPLYDDSVAAAGKYSEGDTHFVIRIDALGRLFQNEFTGLMTDAAISSEETWPSKCLGMYAAGDTYQPPCATLGGGREVPVSVVVIPRLLWTDAEVVDWINDRNDNPLLEIGQHGTYHNSGPSNTQLGDWKDDPAKNFFSCDTCGLTPTENFELLKVGQDTLLGNYDNKWLLDSGATASSPAIDWNASANPLISYAPPFNASDAAGREATALLGYRSWSASEHEEDPASLGQFFSPEGSHHEQFDQFGAFHASADLELEPPEPGMTSEDYAAYLAANTEDGGLNTWLIEEVEWSGRPCNTEDRLDPGTCDHDADPNTAPVSNRENNTVYGPRWEGWLQLLDYAKNYEGGVVMTLGEVALAKGFDNAPTIANADQADSDHDGIGDVIDGAALTVDDVSLSRNVAGNLTATLLNGAGGALAGQTVAFTFDADGDTVAEEYTATTDAQGVASAVVTATREVGPADVAAAWNGPRGQSSSDTGIATVADATNLVLDAAPSTAQLTDAAAVSATLADSDGVALEGRSVTFSIGSVSDSATTDANGVASTTLTPAVPAGEQTLSAEFAGAELYGVSSDSRSITVTKEDTVLTLGPTTTNKRLTTAVANLSEDAGGIGGKTIQLSALVPAKGRTPAVWQAVGSGVTSPNGNVTLSVPSKYKSSRLRAVFAEDATYLGSQFER